MGFAVPAPPRSGGSQHELIAITSKSVIGLVTFFTVKVPLLDHGASYQKGWTPCIMSYTNGLRTTRWFIQSYLY